jgi:predicted MFS family arabinose efflux permease
MTAAPQPQAAPTGSRWILGVLLLIVFVNQIGFGVVFPLQAFYAKVFDAPAWQITLMFAAFSLGQFLGELTWGRLSDRVGRRGVLLLTLLMSGLGYVAFAYAPNIWIAIAVRGVAGVFAGNMSAVQAYAVDVSPPERLIQRLGLIGMAFALGLVLGPSLGGVLTRPDLGTIGLRTPLLAAGALTWFGALGVLLFVRDVRTFDRKAPRSGPNLLDGLAAALRDAVTLRLLLCTFLSFVAISAMWSTSGLWGEVRFGWGPREVGLVLAVAGGFGGTTQGLSGALVRRVGDVSTIVAGLAIAALFLLTLALTRQSLVAMMAICVFTLGYSLAQPSTTSLISRSAPRESQGSVLGANTALAALGRTAGPLAAGALYSLLSPRAPIFLGVSTIVLGGVLALSAGREVTRRRRHS